MKSDYLRSGLYRSKLLEVARPSELCLGSVAVCCHYGLVRGMRWCCVISDGDEDSSRPQAEL